MASLYLFIKRTFVTFTLLTFIALSLFTTRQKYEQFKYHPALISFESKVNRNPLVLELRDRFEIYKEQLNRNEQFQDYAGKVAERYEVASPYIETVSRHIDTANNFLQKNLYGPLDAKMVAPGWKKAVATYYAYAHPHVVEYSTKAQDQYNQYLAKHVNNVKSTSTRIYARVSPPVKKYSGLAYKQGSYYFAWYVVPITRKIFSRVAQKAFQYYIRLRLTYYVTILPKTKQYAYHISYVLLPAYYAASKKYAREVAIPNTIQFYHDGKVYCKHAAHQFQENYIEPNIPFVSQKISEVIAFYKTAVRPNIDSFYASFKKLDKYVVDRYLLPWFSFVNFYVRYEYVRFIEPQLLNSKGENVIAKFFSKNGFPYIAGTHLYTVVSEKLYNFLTSEPVEAEIERLSSLLNNYASAVPENLADIQEKLTSAVPENLADIQEKLANAVPENLADVEKLAGAVADNLADAVPEKLANSIPKQV